MEARYQSEMKKETTKPVAKMEAAGEEDEGQIVVCFHPGEALDDVRFLQAALEQQIDHSVHLSDPFEAEDAAAEWQPGSPRLPPHP